MSTGFLAALRQCQRPLIAVATLLLVLQALVAGMAAARTATSLEPFEAGVICHGAGAGEPDPAPGAHKALCCIFCITTAPALLPVMPPSPIVGYLASAGNGDLLAGAHEIVLIASRAIRARPSQAPPSFA